jgi:hypothetical protein
MFAEVPPQRPRGGGRAYSDGGIWPGEMVQRGALARWLHGAPAAAAQLGEMVLRGLLALLRAIRGATVHCGFVWTSGFRDCIWKRWLGSWHLGCGHA